MEVQDKRSIEGEKPEAPEVEIFGKVAGFRPAQNRILIRRQQQTDDLGAGLIRAQAYTEVSARGEVIAVGAPYPETSPFYVQLPPVGAVATFSKYAETKEFDDQTRPDEFAMPYAHDIHGWHNAGR
jgi:co-chaperonin GroES (HSP10)